MTCVKNGQQKRVGKKFDGLKGEHLTNGFCLSKYDVDINHKENTPTPKIFHLLFLRFIVI